MFRTMIYSESEAYSEHFQTSNMERFVTIVTCPPQASKFFPKYFSKKLSNICGNGTFQPYISHLFQEVIFPAEKMRKKIKQKTL